jgi:RHS repeat-associated protein
MISSAVQSITYDYDNMPRSVIMNNATTTFVYDGGGARVKKATSSGSTIYIGKLYECNGTSCSKYIFAGGSRIALKSGSNTYYYHQDHLGSSSIITSLTSTKIEDIHYLPFGSSQTDTGNISVNHKYTSQEFDAETGFYYYNARYYNPILGRFISADSIVPDPFNPQSLNRYSYVLNNPVNYNDPTGHDSFTTYDDSGTCVVYYDFFDNESHITGYTFIDANTIIEVGFPAYDFIPDIIQPPTTNSADQETLAFVQSYIMQSISLPETGLFSGFRDYWHQRTQENILNGSDVLAFGQWFGSNLVYDFFNPRTVLDAGLMLTSLGMTRAAGAELKGAYTVYRGVDEAGVMRYVGKTMRDPAVRWGEHLSSLGTGREFLRYDVMSIGIQTDTEARIIEQLTINQYGLQKNGGLLLNEINSISPKYWYMYGIK